MTLLFDGHELGIPHAVVLLDLHDDHGDSTSIPDRLELLIAAGLLAELLHGGRLVLDEGRARLKPGRPGSRILEDAEEAVGARSLPIEDHIHAIAEAGLRHTVHSDLVGRGVLRSAQRRRWLVFRESTWPTADPALERALIAHLRALAPTRVLRPEDSLLGLVRVGGLERAVFDGPVDLRPHLDLCPIASVLDRMFEAAVPGYHTN